MKISNILDVPVSYFFEENNIGVVQNGHINNCVSDANHGTVHFGSIKEAEMKVASLESEIKHLNKQLEMKDEIIELLKSKK